MGRAARIRLAWLGAVVLVVLHLAPGFEPRPRLVLGAVPEELAYRLAWMALAFAYLVWFAARVWAREDDA